MPIVVQSELCKPPDEHVLFEPTWDSLFDVYWHDVASPVCTAVAV
jgi:hypothetical protein